MAKIFVCDKCGTQFNSPLDEEIHADEHGVKTIYDLCAPCRQNLKATDSQTKTDFFAETIDTSAIQISVPVSPIKIK